MMANNKIPETPLAERMRPKQLADFVGQEALVGANGILRKMIETGGVPSLIFWGPPGVGKTTLAHIIADQLALPFCALSAVESGVREIRSVIEKAGRYGKVLLFIDEIHRFSKSQQDSLLGAVEKGRVVLIGATTENPSFEVISALLSRCQVYCLQPFSMTELKRMVENALQKDEWMRKQGLRIKEWEALLRLSGGDGRRILNLLEMVAQNLEEGSTDITNERVVQVVQQKTALYDKTGAQHYDLISALIKSIRGSDPNAALYYLARMINGGEDPKFIARRLVILASEDIGNANPNALLLANACFQSVITIGFPESRIILSQTVIYLSTSAKSNSAVTAITHAMELVRKTGDVPVPLSLRNASTRLMKELNYGKDYAYAHAFENNFARVELLPDSLSGTALYEPGDNPAERKMRAYLRQCWKEKYGY